jgi:hypothetical protein
MKISQAARSPFYRRKLRRFLPTVLLLPLLLGVNYCEHKLITPVQLPIKATVPGNTLLSQINGQAHEEAIQARITLDFEDLGNASKGTKRTIPTVNGLLVLKRPKNIRLIVEAPILSLKVADMVSDGTNFKVALLYPTSSKKFLIGTNDHPYGRVEEASSSKNADVQRAGALANIRPQHLTDAILMQPAEVDSNSLYFIEQSREVEPDPDITHKKGSQIARPYYVVSLLEKDNDGEAHITRRVWFDRSVENAPLTRQQFFEGGEIVTDVTYSDFFESAGHRLAKKIFVNRPLDKYAVTITIKPESVQVNNEIPPTAFILNNDEGLPEVNLDTQIKTPPQSKKPKGE